MPSSSEDHIETPHQAVNAWKRKYGHTSGWPNVAEALEAKAEEARAEAMREAGARLAETAKRGPGRPPKSSYDTAD